MKWMEVTGIRFVTPAVTIAKLDELLARHGYPQELISESENVIDFTNYEECVSPHISFLQEHETSDK